MDFASWLKHTREDRGLSIRTLAEKAGVEHTTLSRIENGDSGTTLYTVTKVLNALEGSAEDFTNQFGKTTKKHIRSRKQPSRSGSPILTLKHLEVFLSIYHAVPRDTQQIIAAWLTDLANRISFETQPPFPDFPGFDSLVPPFLGPEVEHFVRSIPGFKCDLMYPFHMPADIILHTCNQGGVLIDQDGAEYLNQMRQLKSVTREELATKLDISPGSLQMLLNGGTPNTKLANLLALENLLGDEGSILKIFWGLWQFNEWFVDHENHGRLVSLLIKIYRWHQSWGDDQAWLDNFNAQFPNTIDEG